MSDTIILKNKDIKIEIAKPWTFYKGCRFDQCGFITQVEYKGNTFCTKESLTEGEGTGGAGMCGEFGIRNAVGYFETSVGNQFPKIGAGLLKRDAKMYYHMTDYEIEPFETEVIAEEDNATFTCKGKACRGYDFIYTKIITAKEDGLEIECYLENTGERPIITDEYVHNFLAINCKPINSDYELFADVGDTVDEKLAFELKNGCLTWDKPIDVYYFFDAKNLPWNGNFEWKLINKAEKLGISETTNFPAYKFNVWGQEHVCAPEVFKQIVLKPGEHDSWKRTYKIFTL